MSERPLVRSSFLIKFFTIVGVIIFVPISCYLILMVSGPIFGMGWFLFGPLLTVLWLFFLLKVFRAIIFKGDSLPATKNLKKETAPKDVFTNDIKGKKKELSYKIYGFATIQALFFSIGLGPLIHQLYYGPSRDIKPVFILSFAVSFFLFSFINTLVIKYLEMKADVYLIGFAILMLVFSVISFRYIEKYNEPTYYPGPCDSIEGCGMGGGLQIN